MVTPATVTDPTLVLGDTLPLGVAEPEIPIEGTGGTPLTPPVIPAPVEAPPTAPFVPTPSQVPSEIEYLRRQLAQVEAEKQTQATEATLVQEARAFQQAAIARGVSDEDALWAAKEYYTVAKRVSQERQQLQTQQQYLKDKQDYATLVGRQYGVDATILMTGNSPQDMVAIAEREKRYAAQEVRMKALEQRQVVPQSLNASSGSRAGAVAVTTDNIDKLWLDHEIAHPQAPNPYDAPYRKLNGM